MDYLVLIFQYENLDSGKGVLLRMFPLMTVFTCMELFWLIDGDEYLLACTNIFEKRWIIIAPPKSVVFT